MLGKILAEIGPGAPVVVLVSAILTCCPTAAGSPVLNSSSEEAERNPVVRLLPYGTPEIEADHQRALEGSPLEVRRQLEQAFAFSKAEKWADAIAEYTKVLAIAPLAVAYNERGIARGETGDLAGSLRDLDLAIVVNPRYALAYLNRAVVRAKLGKWAEAIGDCTAASTLDARWSQPYVLRGVSRTQLGDWAGALKDFTRALELDPRPATYSDRAYARSQLGDWKGAVADLTQTSVLDPRLAALSLPWQTAEAYFSKALGHDPTDAELHYCRGYARMQGDPIGAQADFTRAIDLEDRHRLAYYMRGLVRGSQGDPVGAVADLTRAIELEPRFAAARLNRGIARGELRDWAGAQADWTEAIQTAPSDAIRAEAYERRGLARGMLGDYAGVVEDSSKALELEPSRAEAYENRGLARQQLGDKAGARADLERAFALQQDPRLKARVQNLLDAVR